MVYDIRIATNAKQTIKCAIEPLRSAEESPNLAIVYNTYTIRSIAFAIPSGVHDMKYPYHAMASVVYDMDCNRCAISALLYDMKPVFFAMEYRNSKMDPLFDIGQILAPTGCPIFEFEK